MKLLLAILKKDFQNNLGTLLNLPRMLKNPQQRKQTMKKLMTFIVIIAVIALYLVALYPYLKQVASLPAVISIIWNVSLFLFFLQIVVIFYVNCFTSKDVSIMARLPIPSRLILFAQLLSTTWMSLIFPLFLTIFFGILYVRASGATASIWIPLLLSNVASMTLHDLILFVILIPIYCFIAHFPRLRQVFQYLVFVLYITTILIITNGHEDTPEAVSEFTASSFSPIINFFYRLYAEGKSGGR